MKNKNIWQYYGDCEDKARVSGHKHQNQKDPDEEKVYRIHSGSVQNKTRLQNNSTELKREPRRRESIRGAWKTEMPEMK